MNAASLRASEDILFKRWRKNTSLRGNFVRDGAMRNFALEPFRLVFVLKEANGWENDKAADQRTASEWGHGYVSTWRRLASWSALVLDGLAFAEASTLSCGRTKATLRRVACLNLKKQPGGSVANPNEIEKAAIRDSAFIQAQIALYKPHLTICCGVPVFWPLMHHVYRLAENDRYGFTHDDGGEQYFFDIATGPVMDFWHPQRRMNAKRAEATYRELECNLAYLRKRGWRLPE